MAQNALQSKPKLFMWTPANIVLFSWMLMVWKVVLCSGILILKYIGFFAVFFVLFRNICSSLGLCILFLFCKIRVGIGLCSLNVKSLRTPAVKSSMIPCWNELVRFSALYSHADAAKHLTAVEVKDLWISQTWCAFVSCAYADFALNYNQYTA